MTTKRNSSEGGTAGLTLTTANSGGASGDAWDAFGGSVDPQFSTTHPIAGTKSISYPAAASQTSFHRWTTFAGDTLETRHYFWLDQIPTPSTEILQLRSVSARAAAVYVTNTAHIDFQDAAQASQFMSTATLTAGAGYYLRVWAKRGSSTTDGQMQLDLYTATGSLLQSSGLLTGKNTGTAVLTEVRAGKTSASTWVSSGVYYTDDWQATDASSTGPTLGATPSSPPTSTGTLTYGPYIDVRGSTGTGTLSNSISPSTGVTEPVEGLFLVPAVTTAGTTVTYTVTTTDTSSGLSSTSRYDVTMQQSGSNALEIVEKQANGTWA